jgi:hypothetical protein
MSMMKGHFFADDCIPSLLPETTGLLNSKSIQSWLVRLVQEILCDVPYQSYNLELVLGMHNATPLGW